MLIRRLKEAVFGKIDNCLTCIGTSATLGGGDDEIDKVVEFAHDLFNETFTRDSIITSDRVSLSPVNGEIRELKFYEQLFNEYQNYQKQDKSLKLFETLSKERF